MTKLTYTNLHACESYGIHGTFGLRIEISDNHGLSHEELEPAISAAQDAHDAIQAAIMKARIAKDLVAQKRRADERAQLVALFPSGSYVEEIPNGYCSSWCCAHLPWFLVTTAVGRFKIGWRKRVINIEWDEVKGAKTAQGLFAAESVTKGEYLIHAWSVEDARRYIDTVIASVAMAAIAP